MADAVATTNELQFSRQLAREKLDQLKSGRRGRAGAEYFGAKESTIKQDLGRDTVNDFAEGTTVPESIENNDRLDDFRQNVDARAQRYGQLRALRAARRGEIASAERSASDFARQAYTRVWQLAEEGVHAFAFSFLDLMLLSGPAALVMFVVRFVGGNLMSGSGTIRFREASVPRIPGYPDAISGIYIFGKILLIGLLTGLIYALIIFVIILLVNPGLVSQIGWCIYFDGLLKLIGAQCTA